MPNIRIEEEGMNEAQRLLAVFPREKMNEARQFLNRWGFRIQGQAMSKAPVGVSADLKNDVSFQMVESGEEFEGKLGFNLFYAKYVHGVLVGRKWVGPRRHFVSFRTAPSLERWARFKGIDVTKRKGLWVGGEDKARPFLYDAAIANQNDMIRAFVALGGVSRE